MSATSLLNQSHLVSDEALIAALNAELTRAMGEAREVIDLKRRLSEYYSSYVMEEVDVVLDNGDRLELIFKNLSRDGILEGAIRNKPYFLYNPMREIESYRVILAPHPMGTPHFYGAYTDPRAEKYWLFIERVPGTLLWQYGEEEIWQYVARWLARMHSHLAYDVEPAKPPQPAHLTVFNSAHYWQWMTRAREFMHRTAINQPQSLESIDWLASRFQDVVDRLLGLPVTLIHGEFYPSNVLVQKTQRGLRVCPVDWETAAIGPGLIDLSALTSGSWTDPQRFDMALAYYNGLQANFENPQPVNEFLLDLDHCNLFMAIQWLGWSPNWEPPPEHAQNWLTEACRLARKLQL